MWQAVVFALAMSGAEVAKPSLVLYGEAKVAEPAMITLSDDRNSITGANDEAVRQLAKCGAICRVYGHRWENPWLSTMPAVFYTPGYSAPEHRACALCGRHEVKASPEWVEYRQSSCETETQRAK